MKKKILSIFLIFLMTLSLSGVLALILSYNGGLQALLNYYDSSSAFQSDRFFISLAAMLMCWLVFFIFFVRLHNNGSIFEYGKKDYLTGLGNKKTLIRNYDKKDFNQGRFVCVAYIAYDAEKMIQYYGSPLNEKIQRGAAKVFTESCNDYEYAARIKEGVFSVILRCSDGLRAQQRVIEITNELNRYQLKYLYSSVAPFRSGISFSENGSDKFDLAFNNAALAYRYACFNKMSTLTFSQELVNKEEQREQLYKKLSNAIDNREFEAFVQFVYDVKAEKFAGAEALSRWKSPENGFVMPSYYINDMCTTGLIEKFDMYMLEKVCELLEIWSNDSDFCNLALSCNITRITISSEDFLDNFKKIVKKYSFNPELLILEITEDALIDNKTIAHSNIVECKSKGFKIALDDFGTGNSSFSDITNYPVDQIKVDRQFVNSTSTTKRGSAVLKGLVDMAHNLGIVVVCEGIENQKQLDAVKSTGCDYIQGYYFSYVYSIEEGRNHFLKSLG